MTESTEIVLWTAPEPETEEKGSALTPAQLQLRRMVLDSVTSPHSRRNYAKALDLLFAFAASRPLTRALLLEYRTSMEDLAPSTAMSVWRLFGNWSRKPARTGCSPTKRRPTSPTSRT